MIRRPKPGEDEDDLLEFQKKFLAEKGAPSAGLVSKPGEKRKTAATGTADSAAKRDVVKLEGMPSTLAASEPPPPVKKSRFKAARQRKTQTTAETGEPADVHDSSTATILAQIIERDTRSAPFSCPVASSGAFPSVVEASKPPQTSSVGKKKSVFAQHFEAAPDAFGIDRVTLLPSGHGDAEVSHTKAKGSDPGISAPCAIDGSGLSATFGRTEAHKIHAENADKLASMSPEEILAEQRKLLQMLDPKLVEFLKTRKSKKDDSGFESVPMEDSEESAEKPKPAKQKIKEDPDLPVPVDKSWVHMDKVEADKLQWMKDLPPPSAGDTKTGQQARFDFQGGLIPPGTDVPVNVGLHHHGEEPERAGYTLEELFLLARSSNIQQRALALTTLARVITQAKSGGLSELVQTPVFPSVLDAGVVFLVRWSLDDSVDSVVAAAVSALNALLVNQADEVALDQVFHWHQGHRVACQAPAVPEPSGIKLPDAPDEKAEESDADVAKQDLVKALVYRMDVLPRLRYILEKVRPHAPTVVEILQILVRLARHSTQVAYQVYNSKGLLKMILDSFLPLAWNVQDVSQPLSLVYGVPLTAAMKLVRTLCQAGRHIAANMLADYHLEERLLRFLADNPKTLELPETESYGLQIESLNTWKSCLSYGLADAIYIELYPKLLDQLRCNHSVLYQSEEEQTRLTALIGALEMAVCVASTPKSQAFKRSQDGLDTTTERSESEVEPMLNWAHVEGLIQPVTLLLRSVLAEIAASYQLKKPSLLIPSACLNFVSTYYNKLQTVQGGTDPVSRLDDVKKMYCECMQLWDSLGLQTIRSKLSQHSNILHPADNKNPEFHASLPEYGSSCKQTTGNSEYPASSLPDQPSNSSIMEEHLLPFLRRHAPFNFVSSFLRQVLSLSKIHKGLITPEEYLLPVLRQHTPFNFVSSFLRLVLSLSKIHKGLISPEETNQSCKPVSTVLTCPDLLTYLRKIAAGKPSPFTASYISKFENHLQYYCLKIATLQASQDRLSAQDLSILHCVSLNLLTALHYGDEHLTHDLLSTCIFNPGYWRESQETMTAMQLEDMSLSRMTPTHLRSATETDVTFTLDQLCQDARTHLATIRAAYLAAFAESEINVIKSRSHFSQLPRQTGSCFTSHCGECLLPKDWMFVPLIELFNKFCSVGAELQDVLSASQLDTVRGVLRWIFLMEVERPALLAQVSITLKISRIMCVFLTGNDMFLDHTVHCYMAGLLRYYTKPNLLNKMDFSQNIPGLTSFYDLYAGLLQQYEAVSFGDSLFGCYVLLPLQRRHHVQYRRALWTEYPGILRTLSVSVAELLMPIEAYLEPPEDDVGLIRLYLQSLCGGSLRPGWCPVLYLVATHHVNRFLYTQQPGVGHRKLRAQMVAAVKALKNEEVKQHILFYKKADVSLPYGMELYQELPPIRQNYLDSVAGDQKT